MSHNRQFPVSHCAKPGILEPLSGAQEIRYPAAVVNMLKNLSNSLCLTLPRFFRQTSSALALLCSCASAHAATIQFTASTYTTNENVTPAIVTISRNGDVTAAASVLVTTANGTATATNDYTAVSITVNWAAGDAANKTVSIPVLEDRLVESTETVNLSLSTVTGDTLGATTTATLNIVDYEQGTLQFGAATYQVAETAGTATIAVTRTNGSNGTVTIAYATANGTATSPDFYTATTGVLSFEEGITTQNIVVPIINNTLGQANRDFRINLTTITGGALAGTTLSTTVTIVNDDTDFTPGLTKITPVRTGVTQPSVLSLTQASPFLSTNTLLATINRIPELSITGLVALQGSTGIGTISVGDSTYHFLPYTATQVPQGTSQGIFLNGDQSGHMVTDERFRIGFQPALAAVDVLQTQLTAAQMPKLTVTEFGNITVQRNQGPPPLDLDSNGKLVINNSFYDRFIVRPAIVSKLAPTGAAVGVYLEPHPHPALQKEVYLRIVFTSGTQRRQQLMTTAPLITDELVTSLRSMSGVTDVRVEEFGITTFRFNGRVLTLYADMIVRRIDPTTYVGVTPPRGFFDAGDRNGDGTADFRMLYSTGDEQTFLLLP